MMIHPSFIPVYNWYWYASEFSDMTNEERQLAAALNLGQTAAINVYSIAKTGVPASAIRTYLRVLNYVFHTPGRPPLVTTVKPVAATAIGVTALAIGMDALTQPGADYTRGPYGSVKIVPRLGW